MKRYSIEFSHGECSTKEFNWSFVKDANKPYAYDDYLDAVNETVYINEMIDLYKIESSEGEASYE